YALLDIDRGSPYLTMSAITQLREALETIGIVRTIPIRSSWSDGLHLYIPLPEAVNTFDLAVTLKGCVQAQGFEVKEGHLEIFPNTKAFGRSWLKEFVEYQGHRLPLQPGSGSVLLTEALQPVGNHLGRFWWSWDFAAAAQDFPLLQAAIAAGRRNRKRSKRMLTTFDHWREDLRAEITEGWTAHGQTNHLLKQIGCHGRVFLGLSGDALATYIEDTARACPGYQQWCRHTHEIARKAFSWARSIENFYYPASSPETKTRSGDPQQAPLPDGNKAKQWDATQRIIQALKSLIQDGTYQTLESVTDWASEIVARARCSLSTLYKNIEHWHPIKSGILEQLIELYVMPRSVSDSGRNEAHSGNPNPYLMNGFKSLPLSPFTHLEGGMKSSAFKTLHKKTLSPGVFGGCGGKERFSPGPTED
ncbi:MAG: hypothetical protein F6K42_38540, partial [Leptolyngbya sp. SIO1D8]|nr:hypothetical protein [Leptolyngbya sp. SIO1D8]